MTRSTAGRGSPGSSRTRRPRWSRRGRRGSAYRLDGEVVASDLTLVGHDVVGGYLYGARPGAVRPVQRHRHADAHRAHHRHGGRAATFSMLRGRETYKTTWQTVEAPNARVLLGRPGRPVLAARLRAAGALGAGRRGAGTGARGAEGAARGAGRGAQPDPAAAQGDRKGKESLPRGYGPCLPRMLIGARTDDPWSQQESPGTPGVRMTAATATTTGPGTLSVLHIAQPTDGGVARYVVDAAADQVARGWTVTVVCPDTGWLAGELRRRGIPHVTWNARRAPGPVGGRRDRAAARRRRRRRPGPRPPALREGRPGRAPGAAGRAAHPVPAARLVVARRHRCGRGAVPPLGEDRHQVGRANRVRRRGRGRAGRDRRSWARSPRRAQRCGPGPLPPRRPRRAARRQLGLSPTAPLAVRPARWARQKGQDVLLAAWATVRAHSPAQLALVGGDAPEDLVLPEGVRLVGDVADVRPWLAGRRRRRAAVPLGGPVAGAARGDGGRSSTVVTAIPGLAEVVDERVGATVPAEDADALAAAVTRRLRPVADPRRGLRRGREGDRRARRAHHLRPAGRADRDHGRPRPPRRHR